MALQKTLILKSGLGVADAYIRIDTVSGCKDSLSISVNSYISQDGFTSGNYPVQQDSFNFTPSVADDSANFIKQGYEHLKTLDNFIGAIDC